MENFSNIAEAERLLGVSEKLLQSRDFIGCRDFAILAQEVDPLLDGTDQILAVADVLIASEKRINSHRDLYAVLQLEKRSDDFDLIRKQYRRLALLLHPDKNKFAFSDAAFRLVDDSWSVLSTSGRKSLYDNELSVFAQVDLVGSRNQIGREDLQQKLTARRGFSSSGGDGEVTSSSFWTACPYCYNLYEYARVYEDCCLRCQNCQRAFHGITIPTLPPILAEKEAYHCCLSFFPLPSVIANSEAVKEEDSEAAKKAAITNRQPRPPSLISNAGAGGGGGTAGLNGVADGVAEFSPGNASQTHKKRGRPGGNVQPW